MKKQRKRSPQKSRHGTAAAPAKQPNPMSRRDMMRWIKSGAIAVPILGIAGYFGATSVQARMAEADLSRVGNGRPSIVQIHDPQCNQCQVLQGQTRRILRGFDDETFDYMVADIKTQSGVEFAARYGVNHVTLVLFDASGDVSRIIRGPVQSNLLKVQQTSHING